MGELAAPAGLWPSTAARELSPISAKVVFPHAVVLVLGAASGTASTLGCAPPSEPRRTCNKDAPALIAKFFKQHLKAL